MLLFRLVGRVGARNMGSLRYLLDVQFSLVSKTSLFATCEKLLDDFILPQNMGNCFIESSCAKCHDFEAVDIFFIRCSSTIRFIALRHPIDPIDPGCRPTVESFTEEAAKVIDVISCRCGGSRNLGPPTNEEKKFLGLPYQPGHFWDSLCGSTIDFEIHFSGQDAKKMRMVQDFFLISAHVQRHGRGLVR